MANVQIYPNKNFCYPNDIFSKRLFELSDDDYHKALKERTILTVTDKRNHRRFGNVTTRFRIRINETAEFTITDAFDQFDFAVLCACISEWIKGNRFTTPAIIYRAITGKVGRGDAEPGKTQLADILHSLNKLMITQIAVNMSDACEYLKYNNGTDYKVISAVLPCKRITEITINGNPVIGTTINGKQTTVISFNRESPLWEIACRIKNQQVLSCDTSLLDVPNITNSRMNIAVKFYVVRRVLEIIAHPRQMTPSITFADVFQKCRLTKANKMTKLRVRKLITAIFEHLTSLNIIKAYHTNKNSIEYYSISFTVAPNAKAKIHKSNL